jgi:uncharacterized membrane protein
MSTGSGLIDFLISVVGLIGIFYMIYVALDGIVPDERMKQIARIALGIAGTILALLMIKAVLFGGAGGPTVTPGAVIEFAVAIIVIYVVFYILNMVIDWIAMPALAPALHYLLAALVLIAMLLAAEQALFGGGLGVLTSGRFPGLQQHNR